MTDTTPPAGPSVEITLAAITALQQTLHQTTIALADLSRHLLYLTAQTPVLAHVEFSTAHVEAVEPPHVPEEPDEPPVPETTLFTTSAFIEHAHQPTSLNNRRSIGHFAGQIAREMGIKPYKGINGTETTEYPLEVFERALVRQMERKGGPIE
jgi:hypothetical protein